MSFTHLGLRAELLQAVAARNYTIPTPIQNKTIPLILAGRDLLARAQTGTGKTDAFALPLVEMLAQKEVSGRPIRALVLTPTRELARQVGESIQGYARTLALRCSVVYGGVRIEPQIERLRRGLDILVATPGRLLDLAELRQLDLGRIEFLILDEADRMLDLGFSEELAAVFALLPDQRQTLLFSATYTQPILNLARSILKQPEYLEIEPDARAVKAIKQKVHLVASADKGALLVHLIRQGDWRRVLVFARTRHGADKLTTKLSAPGIRAAALHSNMSQAARTRTLQGFKDGEIDVLVATDIAARGLDISDLPYVINYDLPANPEDYVHRIGRTGRAGASGIAISLVSEHDKATLKEIEKALQRKIPEAKVAGYAEESAVPDYVLYRPGNDASEKNLDPDLKALLAKRAAKKLLPPAGAKTKTAAAGKRSSSKSKSRSTAKSASRPSQSTNSRRDRGRR
ncbi:MAG: DEAD/DEAH box helicase [Deltaproteobacteria bacterium]|nr:DEAD/DEAH box helicase [Deltaproteobacteria bacterium]